MLFNQEDQGGLPDYSPVFYGSERDLKTQIGTHRHGDHESLCKPNELYKDAARKAYTQIQALFTHRYKINDQLRNKRRLQILTLRKQSESKKETIARLDIRSSKKTND